MLGSNAVVAFISSYPPRKCGIATFTADLIRGLKTTTQESFDPKVFAMRSQQHHLYRKPVTFCIRRDARADYSRAARVINSANIDAVCVQHEFGLFGGEAGCHLNTLLKMIRKPVITTLHTVLEDCADCYRDSLADTCKISDSVVVMNQRGIGMLTRKYDVPAQKIHLIPHGIPEMPFLDGTSAKKKLKLEGKRIILTFGLLGRNKGIETMLQAMPRIIAACPNSVYIILGATHPEIRQREGDAYKESLQATAVKLGLKKNIVFRNKYVSETELFDYLHAADVYVTPYPNKAQLTSGTLALAVGTGKAVVSTPYWAAEELLSDGRGKLVPFSDYHRMADAIVELLSDPELLYSTRLGAYQFARNMTWSKVAASYWQLFAKHIAVRQISVQPKIKVPDYANTVSGYKYQKA